MSTLLEVITRVRNTSGDTTAVQFTNSQVCDWVNDGIRECATINNLLQKRGTQNTVVNQASYPLPTDILKMHSVKYDNEKLPVLTLEEFDERYAGVGANVTQNPGTPSVSYVWAGVLTLYPTPSAIKVLVIDYLYTPPLLTSPASDATEIPLPISYHSRIVDYCLAQVAQQDDDMTRYQIKMQEFKTGVQDLKDQPETTYDLYPSFSIDARDMGNGFDDAWGDNY